MQKIPGKEVGYETGSLCTDAWTELCLCDWEHGSLLCVTELGRISLSQSEGQVHQEVWQQSAQMDLE